MTADPTGGARRGRRLKINGQPITVCRQHLGAALTPRAPDILAALAVILTGDQNGCWVARPEYRNRHGYGEFKPPGCNTKLYVHHVAYALFVSGWGQAEQLHHRCQNRACCNPQHLRPIKSRDHEREKAKPPSYGRPRSFESTAAGLFARQHGLPWEPPPTPATAVPPKFTAYTGPPIITAAHAA